MKSPERAVLKRCLAKTKELFTSRKSSEDWADNLIEGSKELSTPTQWKHFYTWLASPNTYDEFKTDQLVIDPTPPRIDPYDECLVIDTVQNGPCETIINITNPTLYSKACVNDEKMEDEKADN